MNYDPRTHLGCPAPRGSRCDRTYSIAERRGRLWDSEAIAAHIASPEHLANRTVVLIRTISELRWGIGRTHTIPVGTVFTSDDAHAHNAEYAVVHEGMPVHIAYANAERL
jgi:hypothetical protein